MLSYDAPKVEHGPFDRLLHEPRQRRSWLIFDVRQKAMAAAFQLVLEFEGDDLENFDRVIGLEDSLIAALPRDLVDGHDVGQGIVNIFIHTDEPLRCFEDAMRVLDGAEPGPSAAAYRPLRGENYVRLWPTDDPTPFKLR